MAENSSYFHGSTENCHRCNHPYASPTARICANMACSTPRLRGNGGREAEGRFTLPVMGHRNREERPESLAYLRGGSMEDRRSLNSQLNSNERITGENSPNLPRESSLLAANGSREPYSSRPWQRPPPLPRALDNGRYSADASMEADALFQQYARSLPPKVTGASNVGNRMGTGPIRVGKSMRRSGSKGTKLKGSSVIARAVYFLRPRKPGEEDTLNDSKVFAERCIMFDKGDSAEQFNSRMLDLLEPYKSEMPGGDVRYKMVKIKGGRFGRIRNLDEPPERWTGQVITQMYRRGNIYAEMLNMPNRYCNDDITDEDDGLFYNQNNLLLNAKGTEAATWSLSAIPSRFSEMHSQFPGMLDESNSMADTDGFAIVNSSNLENDGGEKHLTLDDCDLDFLEEELRKTRKLSAVLLKGMQAGHNLTGPAMLQQIQNNMFCEDAICVRVKRGEELKVMCEILRDYILPSESQKWHRLSISYEGEEGIDAGALKRDFMANSMAILKRECFEVGLDGEVVLKPGISAVRAFFAGIWTGFSMYHKGPCMPIAEFFYRQIVENRLAASFGIRHLPLCAAFASARNLVIHLWETKEGHPYPEGAPFTAGEVSRRVAAYNYPGSSYNTSIARYGWDANKVIKINSLEKLIQSILAAELQGFRAMENTSYSTGLDVFGMLTVARTSPDQFRLTFIDIPITSEKLINFLAPDHENMKVEEIRTKGFFVQYILEAEKRMLPYPIGGKVEERPALEVLFRFFSGQASFPSNQVISFAKLIYEPAKFFRSMACFDKWYLPTEINNYELFRERLDFAASETVVFALH